MTCQPCFNGRHVRCEERRACGCSVCARKARKKAERRALETIVEAEGIVGGVATESAGHSPKAKKHYKKAGEGVTKAKRVRKPPSEDTVFLPNGTWRKRLTERDMQAVQMMEQPINSLATVAKALGYPNRYAVQSVVRRYRAAEEEGVLEHVVP